MREDGSDYLKPRLPERFDLVWPQNGFVDGEFTCHDLVQTSYRGKPWALVGDGFPVVLRVLWQNGYSLLVEDSQDGAPYEIIIRPVETDEGSG